MAAPELPQKVCLPVVNYQIVPPVVNYRFGEKLRKERIKIEYNKIKYRPDVQPKLPTVTETGRQSPPEGHQFRAAVPQRLPKIQSELRFMKRPTVDYNKYVKI